MKLRSLREQIADNCVHFNGIQSKACRAGVIYRNLGQGLRCIPCFKPEDDGTEQCHCDHLRFPTEDEIQARIDEISEQTAKFALAMMAVKPIREAHRGTDWSGILECPVCQGKLHVRHHGYNNHVHAKCETPDCVAWME